MICAFCKHDVPEDLIIAKSKRGPVCDQCYQEIQEVNAEHAEQRAKESGDIEYE